MYKLYPVFSTKAITSSISRQNTGHKFNKYCKPPTSHGSSKTKEN